MENRKKKRNEKISVLSTPALRKRSIQMCGTERRIRNRVSFLFFFLFVFSVCLKKKKKKKNRLKNRLTGSQGLKKN